MLVSKEVYYQLLVQNGNTQYAQAISWALKELNDAGILTPDSLQLLIQNGNAQYAQAISLVFECLNNAGILTPENRQLLVQNGNAQYAQAIFWALDELNNAGILTTENYQLLVQNDNAQYASSISLTLKELNNVGILYQNQGVLNKILNNPKNAGNFLNFVQKNRIQITSENFFSLYEIGAYRRDPSECQGLGSFWKKPQTVKTHDDNPNFRSFQP